jgi:hypothetical protein
MLLALSPSDVIAKRVTEDDWAALGKASNGNQWFVQVLSILNFPAAENGDLILGRNGKVWVKIVRKNRTAEKALFEIVCQDQRYAILSRTYFSPTGAAQKTWNASQPSDPRMRRAYSYAAPGTSESRLIDHVCG